jgi:hypothetical protein
MKRVEVETNPHLLLGVRPVRFVGRLPSFRESFGRFPRCDGESAAITRPSENVIGN